MKKQFTFEFEDGSAKSTGQRWDGMTTAFYSGDEVLRVSEGGNTAPIISGNSAGLVALGKFLIQIGMSDYRDGYTYISTKISMRTSLRSWQSV